MATTLPPLDAPAGARPAADPSAGPAAPREGAAAVVPDPPAAAPGPAVLRAGAAGPAALPPRAPRRPAPGLTVLAGATDLLPLAGYLLRHGPALALVSEPPDPIVAGAAMGGTFLPPPDPAPAAAWREASLERALRATADAGFAVHAVETVAPGGLGARLRALAGEDVGCVVTASGSPRTVRRLARAAGAPVLALPPRGAAAGGPATVVAGDAARVLPAVARALATEHAAVVAGHSSSPPARCCAAPRTRCSSRA